MRKEKEGRRKKSIRCTKRTKASREPPSHVTFRPTCAVAILVCDFDDDDLVLSARLIIRRFVRWNTHAGKENRLHKIGVRGETHNVNLRHPRCLLFPTTVHCIDAFICLENRRTYNLRKRWFAQRTKFLAVLRPYTVLKLRFWPPHSSLKRSVPDRERLIYLTSASCPFFSQEKKSINQTYSTKPYQAFLFFSSFF